MSGRKVQYEKRREAIRLVESGMSHREAAEVIGVHIKTIRYWIDPDFRAKKQNQRLRLTEERNNKQKIRLCRRGVHVSKAKISLAPVPK